MDHAWIGGGPLPDADRLRVYLHALFDETTGDQHGISRMGVTLIGVWGGRTYYVEINLYMHPSWGDGHPDPDLVLVTTLPDDATYIQMRGSAMDPRYEIGRDVEQHIDIDVGAVLRNLVARGYVTAPTLGERWLTGLIAPFIETYQPTRNRRSVLADLQLWAFVAYVP